MKKLFFSLFVACLVILQACNNDDGTTDPQPVTINATDFTASIDENASNGTSLGTVSASASDGSTLTYTLSNESISGSLAIDANTGELTIADETAFDFETNPFITASYTASNGTEEATASITIMVSDVDEAFITTWETTTANETIQIPALPWAYTYNYTVDWGDGTVTTEDDRSEHTYATPGTYQVSITGDFPAIVFFNNSDTQNRARFKAVNQWGDIQWESMEGAFGYCLNFEITATDVPDLSNVESMQEMFVNCTNFNSSIGNWDVSNVKNMRLMFFDAHVFNQDIGSWNVSNVTDMRSMFYDAHAFNQNVGAWNVSNVTDMNNMFREADAFNQNLNSWSVNNVTGCSNFSTGSGLISGNLPSFPANCD